MGIYMYTLRQSKKDVETIFINGKYEQVPLMKYACKLSYSYPQREVRISRLNSQKWEGVEVPLFFHTEFCEDWDTKEVYATVFYNPLRRIETLDHEHRDLQVIGRIYRRKLGKRIVKTFELDSKVDLNSLTLKEG